MTERVRMSWIRGKLEVLNMQSRGTYVINSVMDNKWQLFKKGDKPNTLERAISRTLTTGELFDVLLALVDYNYAENRLPRPIKTANILTRVSGEAKT